jgi:hypothetical protein
MMDRRQSVIAPKSRMTERQMKTFELLLKKYGPLAKANGLDPKSAEFLRFMQQCAAAVDRR